MLKCIFFLIFWAVVYFVKYFCCTTISFFFLREYLVFTASYFCTILVSFSVPCLMYSPRPTASLLLLLLLLRSTVGHSGTVRKWLWSLHLAGIRPIEQTNILASHSWGAVGWWYKGTSRHSTSLKNNFWFNAVTLVSSIWCILAMLNSNKC